MRNSIYNEHRRDDGKKLITEALKYYQVKDLNQGYCFRVNDILDLYPTRARFHNLRTNQRGSYPNTDAGKVAGIRNPANQRFRKSLTVRQSRNTYYFGRVLILRQDCQVKDVRGVQTGADMETKSQASSLKQKRAAKHREHRARWKREGRCIICAGKKEADRMNRTRCKICAIKQSIYNKNVLLKLANNYC